jgi:hypothetical protein
MHLTPSELVLFGTGTNPSRSTPARCLGNDRLAPALTPSAVLNFQQAFQMGPVRADICDHRGPNPAYPNNWTTSPANFVTPPSDRGED